MGIYDRWGLLQQSESVCWRDRANKDASTAFYQAVMWYITGTEIYRQNALKIIRDYDAMESYASNVGNFRFGTVTYFLVSAAEILRYTNGNTADVNYSSSDEWSEMDTTNLTNMMDILYNAGAYGLHSSFMNQHQFAVMGGMARAIFESNADLYTEAVEASTVKTLNMARL